jgi:hypothetical protein
MAPYTQIRLALSTAPDACTQFKSLEFTDIDGPAPVNGLTPDQPLRFGDLDCGQPPRLATAKQRECGSTAHLDA